MMEMRVKGLAYIWVAPQHHAALLRPSTIMITRVTVTLS